jgi:hypothetical protein
MKKTHLAAVTLGLVVAIGAASVASAQPLVKGTFDLPYEVHWGKAVLPPGRYSITIDAADRPAWVTTSTGRRLTYVLARSSSDAMKDAPTALVITKAEGQRVVRSFNWREGNRNFIYRSYAREIEQGATGAEPEAVTVRTARR